MWFRFHKFYLGLRPATQLVILFIINGVFWFAAWQFYSWYFNEPPHSLWYKIQFAAWMSLVITVPANWKKVKQVFSRTNGGA